jgi:flagellar hook protein FlgE
VAQLGTAGAGGRGTLVGSTLEMSNVDLAQEFTNLIIAQRGFQANTKVITASDEILQDLVNLKR